MLGASALTSAQAKRPGSEKMTIELTNSIYQRRRGLRPGSKAKDCQLGSKLYHRVLSR